MTTRKEGAEKIASEARAKGGLALLTALHFEAKDPAYAFSLKLVGEDVKEAISTLKRKEQEVVSKIQNAPTMEDFQKLTGEQEVFGEVILFLEHPESTPGVEKSFNPNLFVVGKNVGTGSEWEFAGIFSSLQKAEQACIDADYFIGPCELDYIDYTAPDTTEAWPGTIRPKG